MGRYAQRQIRGGGGSPGGAAPTIFITDVTWLDNNNAALNFSDVVAGVDVGTFAGFNINGQLAGAVSVPGGAVVNLTFSEQINVDDPWAVVSQPDFLTTLIIVPESGVVAGP